MKELEIELICAPSPQAKGRVERANQTLQDRLTKELRLKRISSEVRETSTGEITIEYKGRPLDYSVYREQEQQQAKVIPAKLLAPLLSRVTPPKSKPRLVPLSHPWRRFDFTENSWQARERRGELYILRK